MTIKIEIPSDNKPLAAAIGRALVNYALGDEITPTGSGEYIKAVPREEEGVVVDLNPQELNKEIDLIGEGNQEGQSPGADNGECSAGTSGGVDMKGVVFIPAVCGEAEKPFYASGPRQGQWKKKRGITDENYDVVYNNALAQVSTQTSQSEQSAEEVFGGQQQQQQQNLQQAASNVGPQEVFELYSSLVQGGQVKEANGVMEKHGLANGTLIYGSPQLAGVIFADLQALAQQGG